jgi:hypothetical protein
VISFENRKQTIDASELTTAKQSTHLDGAARLHALEFQENLRISGRIDFVQAQERGTTDEVCDVARDLWMGKEGHSTLMVDN